MWLAFTMNGVLATLDIKLEAMKTVCKILRECKRNLGEQRGSYCSQPYLIIDTPRAPWVVNRQAQALRPCLSPRVRHTHVMIAIVDQHSQPCSCYAAL